jgi:hypothetical protein
MLYTVSRNGQTYGPYTLEDLQRYVTSGNVLLSDLARAEGSAEWVAVSQVLGVVGGGAATPPPYGAPAPYAPVAGGQVPSPAYPITAGEYNDPPNLSWGLVLLIAIFTCTLFMYVWNIVLAAWMRRVHPKSNAMYFYIGAAVLLFAQMMTGASMHVQVGNMWTYYYTHPLRNLIGLCAWVTKLIARFVMRSDLEEYYNTAEPIGLRLSPVMTFFFGGLYFQYHLNRINEMKRMARYRGATL